MNTAPKLQPGADDELQRKGSVQQPAEQEIPAEEEVSGVYTTAPTTKALKKKLEAEKAFMDEIRSKTGYFDRKAEAMEYAKTLADDRGQDASEKYMREFEKEEGDKIREYARKEAEKSLGGKEVFSYEHAEVPLSPEEKEARSKNIGASLEASMGETKKSIFEVIQPLEIDAADVLTKSGKEILGEKLEKNFLGIIESGGKKPVAYKALFNKGEIVAMGSPGLKKANGEYPENRDGMVIMKTKDGQGLQMIMTHGVSEGPESAALANTAAVSAGFDLSRMHPPHLTDVFDRTNDMLNSIKRELNVPKQRTAIIGVTLTKASDNIPLYNVEILNAGDAHCFVIDTLSGKIVQSIPATVGGEFQKAKLSMRRRKEILDKRSKQTGATPKQIEQVLSMSAGVTSEFFDPRETDIQAGPGEIVVVASSDFMKAFGGHEYFQDGTMGKLLTERLKKGQSFEKIMTQIMKNVLRRQNDGKIEEHPLSVIAFQVPGSVVSTGKTKKPELTVEEVLGKTVRPLELDFEDLKDTK